MRITCIGIDPAGLYLGIRLKRKDPSHVVRFIADARPTSGIPASLVCNPLKPQWRLKDAEARAALDQGLVRFDRVMVKARAQQFQTQGMAFASIDSGVLLEGLEALARGLGCEFERRPAPVDAEQFPASDLLVVADGPHSPVRCVPDQPVEQQDQVRRLRP